MNSFDNLKLHVYKALNKNNKWAIVVHGYTIEGDFISMGWVDRKD